VIIGHGQEDCLFHIKPVIGSINLNTQQNTFESQSVSGTIEELRFYISEIALYHKGSLVWKDNALAHLIDFKDSTSLDFYFKLNEQLKYDELKLKLGIDSVLNTSGALGGDLDPTKGMYWSWQSGYINFKLEGKTINQEKFKYHIGGYQYPYNAIQVLSFPVKKEREGIELMMDLELLLWDLELSNGAKIMRPCKEAVEFSQKLPQIFYINE
jgi:hypothetical protein